METKTAIFTMIQRIKWAGRIRPGRSYNDFFADRILRAANERDVVAAVESLCAGLDADVGSIQPKVTAAFAAAAATAEAGDVLRWIRRHPRVAAMIAGLKDEDFDQAVAGIAIDRAPERELVSGPAEAEVIGYDVPITVRCVSPLAHGSDAKAGNATLFRRRQVLTETGAVVDAPFYGGNAVRGQVRDLLADHLIGSLGLEVRRDKPAVALWFFHVLYAGGVLEEGAKTRIGDELGNHGSVRAEGIVRFRDMLPALSVLGCAVGNRVLPGRVYVSDLRPRCRQWASGEADAADLLGWEYLTRRDDHEGRGDEDAHRGMIASCETLRAGTLLDGGIDFDGHARLIERAAIGRGLLLLEERGLLGAQNRCGLGRVEIGVENRPDPEAYDRFLAENREAILAYLGEIGAIGKEAADACGGSDIGGDIAV